MMITINETKMNIDNLKDISLRLTMMTKFEPNTEEILDLKEAMKLIDKIITKMALENKYDRRL